MDVFWVFLLILFCLVVIMLRFQAIKDRNYFEQQGVMYLGNRSYSLFYLTLKGVPIEQNVLTWYNQMVKHGVKVAGTKEFGAIAVTINDPDVIRRMCVQDFEYFINRREFKIPKEEVLFGKMLFAQRGKEWKNFRNAISPAFTSNKIKRVYGVFEKTSVEMVKFLENQILENSKGPTTEVDFVDVISKFTIEIIGTAVCGIQSKTFESKEHSTMETMSHKMELKFGPLQMFKILTVMLLPTLGNFLKFTFFDKSSEQYFLWAIKKTIKNRQDNPHKHWNDFIQLMLETRNKIILANKTGNNNDDKKSNNDETSLEFLDDDYIVANCVLFILAGFDTTQGVLLFSLYELALHPEMQDRLRAEIEKAVEEDKDEEFISYDKLGKLKYLDMIFCETLRYYPPTIMIDRGCNKDYKVPGSNYVIKKGQGVIIPILGIHRDERFFPNADKFDPERFSDENKHTINSSAYMPFGHGARGCIGFRFARVEAKLGIASLIYHYKIEPSSNTPIPMKYENANTLKPKNGLKLNITKIPRSTKITTKCF